MAVAPAFASTIKVGSGILPAADASLTAPTNMVVLLTAGATGTKIEEVVFQGIATTAAEVINLFVVTAAGVHQLVDQVLVTAITSSTTAVAWRDTRQYTNLVVPATSALHASHTVSGTNVIRVTAFGGDL